MKTVMLAGAAAAALLSVAPALAQVAPVAPTVAKAERVQTRAQVATMVQRQFARFDADRDGVLTQAEIKNVGALRSQRLVKSAERAQRRAEPGRLFERLDADKDGQVTRAEIDALAAARVQRRAQAGQAAVPDAPAHAQRGERMLARLDTDRNGAISRAEFDARVQAGAKRLERRSERAGKRAARPGHAMGRMGGHMLAVADADKDGRVTLPEATAAALRHFDMVDINRDGQVTREERRQVRQQMRGAMGRQG